MKRNFLGILFIGSFLAMALAACIAPAPQTESSAVAQPADTAPAVARPTPAKESTEPTATTPQQLSNYKETKVYIDYDKSFDPARKLGEVVRFYDPGLLNVCYLYKSTGGEIRSLSCINPR